MKTSVRAAVVAALFIFASTARALEARIAVPPAAHSAPPIILHAEARLSALPTLAVGAAPSPVSPAAVAPTPETPLALVERAWSQRKESPWPFDSTSQKPAADLSAGSEHPGPYGLPPAPLSRTSRHEPTPDETRRALAEYRRISAAGEEIFDAPTWVERIIEPGLKAAFGVARAEDILIDYANAVTAELPDSITGDPVNGLKAMRAHEYALWREAVARRRAMTMSAARKLALKQLEAMHRMGLAPPGLEKNGANAPELHAAFARLHTIAVEGRKASLAEARAASAEVSRLIRRETEHPSASIRARRRELARAADASLASRVPAPAARAKAIYETSLAHAKDASDPDNLRHFLARAAGMRAGTVHASPNLGKQLRPTCTLHMLRALLASLGIRKTLEQLAIESRRLLDDPYAGSVTAFDDAMQLRLFRHYGRIAQLRERLFETLVEQRRGLKIRIEIGDPVYKHSLILEGFYELEGETWVSLRDSTSYFPTRMSLEDFGRVLTDDPALYFAEAWAQPR